MADDFHDVKKSLQPLLRALLKQHNVDSAEVKLQTQQAYHLELSFMERSKSTQAD
jgi:hypothetical protein